MTMMRAAAAADAVWGRCVAVRHADAPGGGGQQVCDREAGEACVVDGGCDRVALHWAGHGQQQAVGGHAWRGGGRQRPYIKVTRQAAISCSA